MTSTLSRVWIEFHYSLLQLLNALLGNFLQWNPCLVAEESDVPKYVGQAVAEFAALLWRESEAARCRRC